MSLDVTAIPAELGTYLGITEATAQILLSIVVIATLVLPVMLLSKGKNPLTPILIMFFFAEALLIGLGWMPFWFMIGTVCMMAMAIAYLGSKAVGG